MSRLSERLARAESKLAAIEDRDKMQVIIARTDGKPPLVIDYAPKRRAKSSPSPRKTQRKPR